MDEPTADPSEHGGAHVVTTAHIQRLIANALTIAEECDNVPAGVLLSFDPPVRRVTAPTAPVDHALAKAVADLRHAADELEAERLSCLGWPQV